MPLPNLPWRVRSDGSILDNKEHYVWCNENYYPFSMLTLEQTEELVAIINAADTPDRQVAGNLQPDDAGQS